MVKTDDKLSTFLQRPLTAKLATISKDGSPHVTLVWFKYDGKDLLVSTTKDRVKAKNVSRDNRACIAIDDPQDPWKWAIFNGHVKVEEEGAHALIEELAQKYMGEARGNAYSQRTKTEPRIILRIVPEKTRTMGLEK